jgi:hypothetical protein
MLLISYESFKNLVNLYLFFAFLHFIINSKYIYILHYHLDKLLDNMNETIYSGLTYNQEQKEENILKENSEIKKIEEVKYENKYLEKMRQMDREFHFNEEELKMYDILFPKMFKDEMNKSDNEIDDIENKIAIYKKDIDDLLEQEFIIENDDNNDEFDSDEYKMILIQDKQDKIKESEKILETLKELKSKVTEDEIKIIVDDRIKNYQIKKHLERLQNCYIIEKTPLGNVIMIYNSERETFQYYSDNTIPYRYLEPVGRKYVITFDCRPIFVDMEEELKLAEQKLKEKEEQEKMKLEENKNNENDNNNNKSEPLQKKNVFAKFKSYNKEAGAGKSMVPPPKNSITNKVITNSDDKNEKILLKERANRYSHEGRFSNFNILKKVDKKVVCKKYGMSFAEFKKTQQQSQSKANP